MKTKKEIDKIFPPIFSKDGVDGNGKPCKYIIRGKQEETFIRRLTDEENNILNLLGI